MTDVVLDKDSVEEYSKRIQRGLAEITARVDLALTKAGRVGETIEIVAVTKGFPIEAIVAAAACGLHLFGENYADELLVKANAATSLGLRAEWTFQGRLQTNKINRLVPVVSLWQSVDTADRAQALAKRAAGARVLVQINSTGSAGRSGCAPEEVSDLVGFCRAAGLEVAGLMTVGPDPDLEMDQVAGIGASLEAFDRVNHLAITLGLSVRSMGMSSDLEAALQCGATMIRIGSALFGARSVE